MIEGEVVGVALVAWLEQAAVNRTPAAASRSMTFTPTNRCTGYTSRPPTRDADHGLRGFVFAGYLVGPGCRDFMRTSHKISDCLVC